MERGASRTSATLGGTVTSGLHRRISAARHALGRARRRALSTLARAEHHVPVGRVALTFDDGPHPLVTPQVLDALAATGARATFFVVGQRAEQQPDIVRRIVADGHSLGTHTMHHVDLRTTDRRRARAEIDGGRRAVEAIVGRPVQLFRPPRGHLTLLSAWHVRARRWRTVLWTDDPHDWKDPASTESIIRRGLLARDGGVVVLHDTSAATAEATAGLIAGFRGRGLELVGL